MIAFESGSQIYVMNVDGSDQLPLTFSPVDGAEPDWGRISQDTLVTDVLCWTGGLRSFCLRWIFPSVGITK
jgi:hypothetical protein